MTPYFRLYLYVSSHSSNGSLQFCSLFTLSANNRTNVLKRMRRMFLHSFRCWLRGYIVWHKCHTFRNGYFNFYLCFRSKCDNWKCSLQLPNEIVHFCSCATNHRLPFSVLNDVYALHNVHGIRTKKRREIEIIEHAPHTQYTSNRQKSTQYLSRCNRWITKGNRLVWNVWMERIECRANIALPELSCIFIMVIEKEKKEIEKLNWKSFGRSSGKLLSSYVFFPFSSDMKFMCSRARIIHSNLKDDTISYIILLLYIVVAASLCILCEIRKCEPHEWPFRFTINSASFVSVYTVRAAGHSILYHRIIVVYFSFLFIVSLLYGVCVCGSDACTMPQLICNVFKYMWASTSVVCGIYCYTQLQYSLYGCTTIARKTVCAQWSKK